MHRIHMHCGLLFSVRSLCRRDCQCHLGSDFRRKHPLRCHGRNYAFFSARQPSFLKLGRHPLVTISGSLYLKCLQAAYIAVDYSVIPLMRTTAFFTCSSRCCGLHMRRSSILARTRILFSRKSVTVIILGANLSPSLSRIVSG